MYFASELDLEGHLQLFRRTVWVRLWINSTGNADRIAGKRGRYRLQSEIISIEDTFDENVLVCNNGAEHCESGRLKFRLYGNLRNNAALEW